MNWQSLQIPLDNFRHILRTHNSYQQCPTRKSVHRSNGHPVTRSIFGGVPFRTTNTRLQRDQKLRLEDRNVQAPEQGRRRLSDRGLTGLFRLGRSNQSDHGMGC